MDFRTYQALLDYALVNLLLRYIGRGTQEVAIFLKVGKIRTV